ncbi:MAG TPA: choice-of-anchor X domain-containing protein [Chitinophagaceae bacterium]
MKTPKKFLLLCTVAIFTTALVSWNHLNKSAKKLNTSAWSYLYEKDFPELTDAELTAENLNAFITGDEEFEFAPESGRSAPPAEDVLIQKIPGDNNHLLIMAFYSKENYSGKFITLENGGHLVFRDDGNGYDKKAGDGLYTARIQADLKEFRQTASGITAQMKKSSYRPVRFEHRAMIVDPDADESFDLEKLERGEVVSISGLTNALSDLDVDAASSGAAAATTPGFIDSIRTHCTTITSRAVVEDPTRTWNSCTQKGNINGPWTFNTIMRQLASKDPSHIATDAQVSDFVKNWLSNWASTRIVNGDTVAARTTVNGKILSPWLTKSKNAGAPTGQLDMRFAPFKLLAIVNRFDLRDGGVHGIPGSAVGEGRFVFGLINSTCDAALKMGVILEFGVNKPNTCDAIKAWAQQWFALKNMTVGSSQYNQALQNITAQFALCGTNPGKPNQSSLDQLRTNEQTLSTATPGIWEMREFILDPSKNGFLKQNTVAQNPADKYCAQVNNASVQRLVAYVNQNSKTIKRDSFEVPLTWQGFPFLGGAAKLINPTTGDVAFPTGQPPKPFHWDGTNDSTNRAIFIRNNSARFNFSLQTCWGCHGGETQTGFTHVDPVFYGKEATLSGFLTGHAGTGNAIDFDKDSTDGNMTVKDPALRPLGSTPTQRVFNDMLRRARFLNAGSKTTCGSVLGISSELLFKPLNSVD